MPAPPPADAAASRARRFGAGVALGALVLAAYLPALRGGFVWDDDATLTRNPVVAASDGLRRIWLTTEPRDYWPVTYSGLWAEWRLWGPHPLGYHAVSVALHLATVLLLWGLLRRVWEDPPGAWLAAALFALHPVNVESVAWVTQQKNLLAMLFYLAAIHAFWRAEEGGRPGWRLLALAAFGLAMLSKGSVAMLPFVFLGMIRWRQPLTRRDWGRIAPFFVVAFVLVAVNLWFQAQAAGGGEVRGDGLLPRILGAAAAGWFYLCHALWPTHLAFIYPDWQVRAEGWRWWLPLAAALAATGGLAWAAARHRLGRGALFAWTYFWAALVPVLGFVDVYYMRYSPVADHYQHLAIIGVVVWVAAGWRAFVRRFPARGFRAVPVFVLAWLGILTWRQGLNYRDSRTLYLATLRANPRAWLAHFNLGEALLEEGRVSEAIGHFEGALRAKPDYFEARNNLGIALAEANRLPEAAAQFEAAVRLQPGYAPAHVNLGKVWLQERRAADAIAQFREAVRLGPDSADAHRALGVVLNATGQAAEARQEFAAAARLDRRP
ncbi:MAG TPA: tetratricopeptide repeat protein [Opitutaceae bacterium]|nr:tetratricopeptide repeat protein [Opitutaceae bacterium]